MGQEERGKQRRGGKTAIQEARAGVIKAQGACWTVGSLTSRPWSQMGHEDFHRRQRWLVRTSSSQQGGPGEGLGQRICFLGSCQQEPLLGVLPSLDSHVPTTVSGAISESNTANVAILIPARTQLQVLGHCSGKGA